MSRFYEWERPAPYGDGQLLGGYKWLLSLYVFGLHFMIGRRKCF